MGADQPEPVPPTEATADQPSDLQMGQIDGGEKVDAKMETPNKPKPIDWQAIGKGAQENFKVLKDVATTKLNEQSANIKRFSDQAVKMGGDAIGTVKTKYAEWQASKSTPNAAGETTAKTEKQQGGGDMGAEMDAVGENIKTEDASAPKVEAPPVPVPPLPEPAAPTPPASPDRAVPVPPLPEAVPSKPVNPAATDAKNKTNENGNQSTDYGPQTPEEKQKFEEAKPTIALFNKISDQASSKCLDYRQAIDNATRQQPNFKFLDALTPKEDLAMLNSLIAQTDAVPLYKNIYADLSRPGREFGQLNALISKAQEMKDARKISPAPDASTSTDLPPDKKTEKPKSLSGYKNLLYNFNIISDSAVAEIKEEVKKELKLDPETAKRPIKISVQTPKTGITLIKVYDQESKKEIGQIELDQKGDGKILSVKRSDVSSTSDPKGAAGNDKVSGGEPNAAGLDKSLPAKPQTSTPESPLPATPGNKEKDVPQPAKPEASERKDGNTEAAKELPPAVKEIKEHFSQRYANLSPDKQKEVMKAIEGMNPESALAMKGAYQTLSPQEREIYDKAGPKIVERLAQLSPSDVRLYFQASVETDPEKYIKLHNAMSPEGKAVCEKTESSFSKEENNVWDKLDAEHERLLPQNLKRSPDQKGGRLNDAFKNLSESLNAKPADWDGFFAAAAEIIAAFKAIFKPGDGRNTAGDTGNTGPSAGPNDGGNSSSEKGPEVQITRQNRLRNELKNSTTANTSQELVTEKKQIIEKQKDSLRGRIEKVDAETKGLKTDREGLQKKIADTEGAIAKAKPEEREAMQSELRMVKQDMKSLDDRITARENESKSLTEKMNAAPVEMEADIKELESMREKLQKQKDAMDVLMRGLKERKNAEVNKVLDGVSLAIDEKNLTFTVTATPDAQKKIQELSPELKFDSTGKCDPEKFADVLTKLTDMAKNQPGATPSGDAPPSAAPTSPDTSSDIKGALKDVIKGTLGDTQNILGDRIGRAQKNLADQKKDLAEVKGSWNPFRNGEQRNKENAVNMQEAALKVLQSKVDQLKAIPTDDPKKQLDGIMRIREELGLPKVPQEFAKDYDTFQKMASEGIDKKDKSTEVDYAALNKELQDIDATLANVEMGLEALDTAAGTAASLVPFGSKVYSLSQMATYVATGNKTPQQAGVDFATSFVFGKLGGKVMASAGGKKLIEKYSMKFAEKFFSNPNLIKKFTDIASKKISGEVIKQVDNVIGLKKAIGGAINTGATTGMKWLNDGGKWLGEKGYALAEDIAPTLQGLSADVQKQFGDGMKAFQEIKTGIMTSTATDFAQGYKGKFKDMYGGAVQSATDQIKKIPGLDPAKVDALVTQVTGELEKQFDNAAKTVQDVNDKGAGAVLRGFVADLRVVGGDAYEKNIAPLVANLQEGGQKLAAEGMQMLKAIKESTATDFGKGYKEQFAKMYGPKIEQAKGLLVQAGLDKGQVDKFVADVTAGIEKGFDKGTQTVQDINDKGAGNVLRSFAADLRVVGGDAYDKYLAPYEKNIREGGRQMMADGMQMLNEIKTGVMTSTTQDFAKGYKEQFQGLYGAKIEQAKGLLVQAGLEKGDVDAFVDNVTAGIEKQFDAGVKTATEMQQKGVAVVLREFSADMGTIAEQGYKDYIQPRVDSMSATARPHMERAMKQFANFKEGAAQLIAQDPKQTAQEYVQRLQKAYGPAIEAARTELVQAGITPDNAQKFLDATLKSAQDGFQRVAARVQG